MEYAPPYALTDEIVRLTSAISEKIGRLDLPARSPIPPHLRRANRVRSIRSSVAIEGSSLSEQAVSAILEGKRVAGPPREILEVQRAREAYAGMPNLDPFSEPDLLRSRAVLMEGLATDAGAYRTRNEGVFRGSECIFMAPPPHLVPSLMSDLFSWLGRAREAVHPLVFSCVFHYEFVFIHPFSDGNGRMARLWHTALLADWRSVFAYIPLETQLASCQAEYYQAISDSHAAGESTPFLSFMLRMIERAVDATVAQTRVPSAPPRVRRLLDVMEPGTRYTGAELLAALGLKSRETLRRHYLSPAMEMGLVRLAFPDKPASRNQAYIRA